MVIPREPLRLTLKGLRRDYTPTPKYLTKAYLLGILHDSTERKTTYRISQKGEKFVKFIAQGIKNLGRKAWGNQKDKQDLLQVKLYLEELGINCGVIHNPSKKVDPDYWRFYILISSWKDFILKIGSFHPDKLKYLG